jgi:hypothetical protein
MRTWIASLHRGQLLTLLSLLALGSCGAGMATFSRWSADGNTCAAAGEFSDSLAANRRRLADVDEVLARFDLSNRTLPDSSFAKENAAPNRLERRIIALRMEGVTAPQIERWITHDVRLDPRPADGRTQVGDSIGQLAKIHAYEKDTAYVHYLHASMQVTSDYWHDMTVLPPLAARWVARCSAYRRDIAIGLPLWALVTGLLVVSAWLAPGTR